MSVSKSDKAHLLNQQVVSIDSKEKTSSLKCKTIVIVSIISFILIGVIFVLLFIFEVFPSSSSSTNNLVSTEDIRELRELLFDFFELTTNEFGDREPKIATTVRLAFHDCGGPPVFNFTENDINDNTSEYFDFNLYPFNAQSVCDGGIDFTNNDHSNLEKDIIQQLDEIYLSGFDDIMSRADFWMAAGIIALEKGAINQNSGAARFFGPKAVLPDLPFAFGRIDCPTSPNCDEGGFRFPAPTFLLEDTLEFFETVFNFTVRETVTILGAHTLGRAHQNNSGFKNRWVGQEHVLNHAYYVAVLEQHRQGNGGNGGNGFGWVQRRVNRTGNLQWTNSLGAGPKIVNTSRILAQDGQPGDTDIRLMFNSDLSLVSRLADNVIDSEGRVNCSVSSFVETEFELCPIQEETIDIIQEFAGGNGRGTGDQANSIWINEFRQVFNKMILMGYPDSNRKGIYFVDGGRSPDTL